MATFNLKIECENEAFFNPDGNFDPAAEIASILERACRDALRDGTTDFNLYDTNGNKVGFATLWEGE